MRSKLIYLLIAALISTFNQQLASASEKNVHVVGRKEIVVTKPELNLGDIAECSSKIAGNDETVIALKKISLGDSPAPGREKTLSAAFVLDHLRSNGVDLNAVGYMFPRIVKIKRAGRKLQQDELLAVIERVLTDSKRDVLVRGVDFDDNVFVSPGEITLSAQTFDSPRPGRLGFSFLAESDGERPIRFDVLAKIDEWREIPVASRPITRGSILQPEDIQRARFNVSELPKDVAFNEKNIFGLKVSQNIAYGEVFRKNKLDIPPVIEMGAMVTMVYSVGKLKATASGVALESGAVGDDIKIRNDSSKKVILGRVLEPGLVGVSK